MGWDKWTNGHLCVRGMTYWLMMMHKWLFFANDISGSYGICLYFHALFSLSIAQPTPKPRPTFEWAGWMSQRTQRRDRRLRFQLPSLRFASYWNSMCIVDCRLVKQKKRSHRERTRTRSSILIFILWNWFWCWYIFVFVFLLHSCRWYVFHGLIRNIDYDDEVHAFFKWILTTHTHTHAHDYSHKQAFRSV